MRYYYVDENDQTAGPVEEASFYEALRIRVLEPGTLVTAEGTEDWQPLAAVLPYYFSFGDGSAGPLPLAKLEHLAAASNEPLMVLEPGGSEWLPLESLLSAPAPAEETAAPAPPSPPVFNPYAPPSAVVAFAAPPPGNRPPFPASVKAAGVIWTLYGALRLITAVIVVVALMKAAGAVVFLVVGLIIPVLIGVVFLRIGLQTCRGAMADVKGNGAGSIGIGILLFIMSFFTPGLTSEYTKEEILVEACVDGVLVVAGILALTGRAGFLAWKRWTPPRVAMAHYRH